MKTLLIIDGYNAIYKIPELCAKLDQSLEAAREALAAFVGRWRSTHPEVDCLIVFDGKDDATRYGSHTVIGRVRCFFTRTQSDADDEIIRQVREHHSARTPVIVVSDDNYVRNNFRAHGARIESVSYLVASPKHQKSRGGKAAPDEKIIDMKTMGEINKELRRKYGL